MAETKPSSQPSILGKAILVSGVLLLYIGVMIFLSAATLIRSSQVKTPLGGDPLTPWVLTNFGNQIMLSGIAVISILFGIFIMRMARTSMTQVIPDSDREVLESALDKGDEKAIELYIRLSALKGFSGTFAQLGITGLPFATVLLTLLLAMSGLVADSMKMGIATALIDMSKLTLGAFIGSFVQNRAKSPTEKVEEAVGQ